MFNNYVAHVSDAAEDVMAPDPNQVLDASLPGAIWLALEGSRISKPAYWVRCWLNLEGLEAAKRIDPHDSLKQELAQDDPRRCRQPRGKSEETSVFRMNRVFG